MITHAERLRKLADFIEPMPPEKFDFRHIIGTWDDQTGCGTNCCALGWAPAVFPGEWVWAGGTVSTMSQHCGSPFHGAEDFFGLDAKETEEAFVPWDQSAVYEEYYGDEREVYYCDASSTGAQVAKNLRRLADIVEARA